MHQLYFYALKQYLSNLTMQMIEGVLPYRNPAFCQLNNNHFFSPAWPGSA
jgi:hypothetical protein